MSEIARHTDLYSGRNVYLTSWFILSVLILTGGLHPGRIIYLTVWFILSVLFMTLGETSVVPTPETSHRPLLW